MSFCDYLNLDIARHTALSDAQYLKLNLPPTSTDLLLHSHMPKYLHVFVRVFRQCTKSYYYENPN